MKILTILIIGLIVCGIFVNMYIEKDNEIDFKGVKISSKNLKDLTEPLPEGGFMLCSLEDNTCAIGLKRKLK